jgi:hypothetical protein
MFYSQIWLDLPNHLRHNFSTSFLFYGCSPTVASTAQHSVCVCVFFSNNTTQLIVCDEKNKNFLKKITDAAATTKVEYCQRLKI